MDTLHTFGCIVGLPVDIEPGDLKSALEAIPGNGQVTVSARYGDCRGYSYQINFLTTTGYQPPIQVRILVCKGQLNLVVSTSQLLHIS